MQVDLCHGIISADKSGNAVKYLLFVCIETVDLIQYLTLKCLKFGVKSKVIYAMIVLPVFIVRHLDGDPMCRKEKENRSGYSKREYVIIIIMFSFSFFNISVSSIGHSVSLC